MALNRALIALREKLRPKGFLRSVGVLAGGTAMSQALAVLVLPVVTRLYSPADFGVLAVFVSLLTLASISACMRLEIAIPLPEHDGDAVNLLALAMFFCTATAALLGIIVWLFSMPISELVGQPSLRLHLWLLPLGVWLAGAYAVAQFWSSRKGNFGAIAKSRIVQATGGSATQLGFGYGGSGPFGLVIGQLVANGAGLLILANGIFRNDRVACRSISLPEMSRVLRQYNRFPKFSTFEALANSAGIQLPLLIISAVAAGPEIGYLFLAMRAMGFPMSLIGTAVSQVYLSRAPNEHRAGTLSSFTAQVVGGLVKSGVGPLIFIGITAPVIFPLFFGATWQRAGDLVAWMTPWFVVQFVTSPVSMTLHITGQQRSALLLQVLGVLIRTGAVLVAGRYFGIYVAEFFAVSGFIFYLIYAVAIARHLSLRRVHLHTSRVITALPLLLLWVTGGILVRIVLHQVS